MFNFLFMKQLVSKLAVMTAVLALAGQGCATSKPSPVPTPAPETKKEVMKPKEVMEKDVMEPKDAMEKPSASTYQPFTKAAYDAAKASGNPIFLFFYANWCPTCREQDPRLQRVLPTHMGGVVGFRVNFNDTETDADEKALAKEFGVTYQHTGFFIAKDGSVKQKTIGSFSDSKTIEYLDLLK